MTNDGKNPAVPPPEDWRTLAEQASTEADSNKLVEIVEHLCDVIDQKNPEQGKRPGESKKRLAS
jgi:hypothetical protein